MARQSNLPYVLALSPLLLTILLALFADPASASGGHHAGRTNKRHANLIKARRDAGGFDIATPVVAAPVSRRTISLGKRQDGGACKNRGAVSVSSSASVAPEATPSPSPAAEETEKPAEDPTTSVAAASTTYASESAAAVAEASSSQDAATSTAAAAEQSPVNVNNNVVAPASSSAWTPPTTEAAAYVAPTTTHQTTLATAGPIPSDSPNSCRKAGLAWPNGGSNKADVWAKAMGNSWYYTWSPWPTDALSNLEFVPMLWGWKQVGDWTNNIQSYTSLGVKHALFVNEPNGAGQSNMNAASGCELWFQHFEQLRSIIPGIKLGSASPDGAPSGKQWLVDFTNNCAAKPDFITLHWYDVTYQNFQDHVTDFANTWPDLDLWVTEYACQNFNGGAQCNKDFITGEFFEQTTGWMNKNPRVARYSIFGTMGDMQGVNTDNALMQWDGTPTDYGWAYTNSY